MKNICIVLVPVPGGELTNLFCLTSLILDEKNERVRDTVRKKVVEYMARAEKIKEHLAKLEEKPKKKAMAASSNGGGKGGK